MHKKAKVFCGVKRIVFILFLVFPLIGGAQQTCPEPSGELDAWKQALLQVDSYRSTYVLIYPDRLAEKFSRFGPSTDSTARIAAHSGVAMEISRSLGMKAEEYSLAENSDRIVKDLLEQKIDAAIVWGPLAGWMIQKLDASHELSMYTSVNPAQPPQEFTVTSAPPSNPAAIAACSQAVQLTLETYGVVPPEPFKLDIFEVMTWRSSDDSSAQLSQGNELFERYCASCHGKNAIPKVKTLAPVDLLKSVRKFTYGGFSYITLKGRNIKGMPGYHGILQQEQLQQLYEYVRARSAGRMARNTVQQ